MKIKVFIFPNMLTYAEEDPDGYGDLMVRPGADTTPELVAVIDAEDIKSAAPKIIKIAEHELSEMYDAPLLVDSKISSNKFILSSFGAANEYDYEMTVCVDIGAESATILIGLKCS